MLDAFVVLDDGVVERPELTIALDVATRTIRAAVLRAIRRPQRRRGTAAGTDDGPGAHAARLGRGAGDGNTRWCPYERLLSVDARLEGAAARPVITPQTIVVGQGKVFISSSFTAACESLGMCVQPAPPGNGPAKEHVERTFSSISTLFVQHVAACTGSHTGERGKDAEGRGGADAGPAGRPAAGVDHLWTAGA
ncbi:hypothetical protein [Streptomyces werraensis]|uniref:hypothetical protein n=1 Tax=Streptomyces werraensis TaxID=68284 RepID=UPI0037D8CBB8